MLRLLNVDLLILYGRHERLNPSPSPWLFTLSTSQ